MMQLKQKQEEGQTTKSSRNNDFSAPLFVIILCGILASGTMLYSAYAPNTSSASTQTARQGNQSQQDADAGTLKIVRGEYRAVSQNADAGRIENIRLTAETLNGASAGPGETISFNTIVGNTAADERYQIAPLVSGYDASTGRGGGTNQVASALYVAALYAGLEIVERHPHTVVPDYTTAGLDAMVSYDDIMDLKIRNNTTSSIRITTEATGQTVTVKIFGEPFIKGLSVGTTTELVGYNVSHNYELGVDELYCIIASYRVYFTDGARGNVEELSKDTYLDPRSDGTSLPDDSAGALRNSASRE
jgi:hypothetical protein